MVIITLKGNPLSTNNVYRHTGNRTYMTTTGKDRKEEYGWEARSQWHGPPLKGPLSIEVNLYFGDKRKRDWDNFHKISGDSLSGIVWEDDSQIEECHVKKRYDLKNPRIEIIIYQLDHKE